MGNILNCSCSGCQGQNEIPLNIMPEELSMEHVDDLITYIHQLISKRGGQSQGEVSRPETVAASINSGGELIDTLSKRLADRPVCKTWFLSPLDPQTRNVAIEVLDQAQPIPYLGMALSITAHLLERAELAASNKDECLSLLVRMVVLAKHVKNLDILLDRTLLDKILRSIVKGTLICARHMQPDTFYRFISVYVDAADLKNVEKQLSLMYDHLALEAVTQIHKRVPTNLSPSQGVYPPDAVGIEKAQEEVTELLDLKDSSQRVVVIYGVGGIGKTTLATAVFSSLELKGYHHCRVDMDQDCKNSDLKAMQEQILRNLFKENLTLDNYTQGLEKLSEAFEKEASEKASKPLFLFIDNALKQTDIKKLLPFDQLSKLPMRSRILVTTRDLNQTNIFGRVHPYRVDSVSKLEATRVLCQYALGDRDGCFEPGVDTDGFLQICNGIPLILRIVGSHLRIKILHRDRNIVSVCNDTLQYFKEWQQEGFEGGEENVSESIVGFVYGLLKEPCKQAFLDIAAFFHGWERIKVEDIIGRDILDDLEGAALVTKSEADRVKMHDIVRALGRKLSEGNRITNRQSLVYVIDAKRLQQTKGILLPNDNDELSLEAEDVDLMSSSLRVLSGIRVNGRCRRGAFEDLRLLDISCAEMLPMDLSKSSKLVVCRGHLVKGDRISEAKFTINLPQSPQSLRLLYLEAPEDSPVSVDINGHLTSVRKLQLSNITFENFETNIRSGNFSSLRKLHMASCSMLETLPQTFGQLSCLQTLKIDSCKRMCSLSDNFGQLKCLKFLSIRNCEKLKRLPDDIECSTSLVAIEVYRCAALEAKTIDILVKIRSLMILQIYNSPMLIKRWEEIQQQPHLIGLPLLFGAGNYTYEERMSPMFFNGGSRFLQVDGEGQLAEVASSTFLDVGVKVCLLLTTCPLSEDLKQKLEEVSLPEFQIIYVDVDMEGEVEGSSEMEERDRRIREMLVQLPEGSRAWTSSIYKTKLLFAYSLWKFAGHANTSIVGTRVLGGTRKLFGDLELIFPRNRYDTPGVELSTLFSLLEEAKEWMGYLEKIVLRSDINCEKIKRRKIVLKVQLDSEKCKRMAIKTVAEVPGIDSVQVDSKGNKLTVIGDSDPVEIVSKLRKYGAIEILSVGPA